MEPILEWAEEWLALVQVVGVLLLLLYVRETYLIRLAAITSGAPSMRLVIAEVATQPRLRVRKIEGRVAYNVLLEGFGGMLRDKSVRCLFEPVPHLESEQSADLDVLVETPDGRRDFGRDCLFEVLESATGQTIGLPLRLRYQDGMGLKYLVKVTMPNRIYLGFMSVIDVQPACSPPVPMTVLARLEDRIVWPLARAWVLWMIRRERRPGRRPRRTARIPGPAEARGEGTREDDASD